MPIRDVRYDPPDNVTVGTGSTVVVTEDGERKYLLLTNDSNETIYLGIGADAVLNKGTRLNAEGGSFEMIRDLGGNFSHQKVNAISASGGKNLLIQTAKG